MAAMAVLLALGACATVDDVAPSGQVLGETTVRDRGAEATTTTTAATQPEASLATPQSTVVDAPTGLDGFRGPHVVELVESIPHDPTAFTQGLVLLDDGTLVESTGLTGDSRRQRIDAIGVVGAVASLPDDVFGTGLALADGRLLQFTLEGGEVIVADPVSLDELDRRPFADPVWGACGLGDRVVTSNGSSTLTIRNLDLEPVDTVTVTLDGEPVTELNELACADGRAVANVWLSSSLVVVDLTTGAVTATIDASSLAPDNALTADDVLNGVAFDADTNTLWLTGKRWDRMFRVALVPVG